MFPNSSLLTLVTSVLIFRNVCARNIFSNSDTPVEPFGFDCINGCPADDALDYAAPPPETPTDVTNAGNYLITNCLLGQDGDQATGLRQRMIIYGQQVSKVIDSLNQPDVPGFTKWFRKASNIPVIKKVFQTILAGNNVVYNGASTANQPTLTCVRDGSSDPDMQKWWTQCNNADPSKRSIAFHVKNTGTVMLCPRYFELPENAPTDRCPHNDLDLVQNQFGVLVHEWIHVFGDTDVGQTVIGGTTFGGSSEYYNPYQAKRLDQFDARLNPQVRDPYDGVLGDLS